MQLIRDLPFQTFNYNSRIRPTLRDIVSYLHLLVIMPRDLKRTKPDGGKPNSVRDLELDVAKGKNKTEKGLTYATLIKKRVSAQKSSQESEDEVAEVPNAVAKKSIVYAVVVYCPLGNDPSVYVQEVCQHWLVPPTATTEEG